MGRLIDAERELVDGVELGNQLIAASDENVGVHQAVVDFREQRAVPLGHNPEAVREQAVSGYARLEPERGVHGERDEGQQAGAARGGRREAVREQHVRAFRSGGERKQRDDADPEHGDQADDPFGGARVDHVILGDPLRIQTHVVDDFERKHQLPPDREGRSPARCKQRTSGTIRSTKLARHLGVLTLFASLAVAWTWPLALHLGDALAGGPGDNYSFVWNLWWMRHVLATPGLPYFHTTFLFNPFGTTIADHPHTALPALIAATLLKPATLVAAQNLLLLFYVFGNLAAMYALAWTVTRHLAGSVLAAIVFGLSPYVAVHILGHFDLVAAFTIPLFALALHRCAGVAAGLLLAATSYIAYYHVVYLLFFAIVYLVASVDPIRVSRRSVPQLRAARVLRHLLWIAAAACGALALEIVISGGWSLWIVDRAVPVHAPQNALTAAWICAIAAAILTWRPALALAADVGFTSRPAFAVAWRLAAAFAVGSTPLLWEAGRLVARGEYVTQQYGWRSIPHGVDLLAPFVGHPLHPVFGALSMRAYDVFGQNFIEVVGWFGVVPIALLALGRGAPDRGETNGSAANAAPDSATPARSTARNDLRVWRIVAVVFFVWALGPLLVVGGFDTGLKLPAILLRYVPFVANARMPGRAIVIVYMAVGVLLAMQISRARGRLASPTLQWVAIAAVTFEFWTAPLPLTAVDHPAVYRALAAAPPGPVCEVPFGIGDGLSTGIGAQDRRVLLYATQHEHPLVGGFIGRMPADAANRYRTIPVAGTLLALSDGAPMPALPDRDTSHAPCRYLVVDRRALSPALASYLQLLAPKRISSDDRRDLLEIR